MRPKWLNIIIVDFQEACIDVLKVVKSRINSQHEDMSSHLLLSIFKIAEVDVVYPAPPSSGTSHLASKHVVLIMISLNIMKNLGQFVSGTMALLVFCRFVVICLMDFAKGRRVVPNTLEVKHFIDKRFVSILEMIYEEFIDIRSYVGVVHKEKTSHTAHALGNAHGHNTIVADIYLHKRKEMTHIVEAVSITIFGNFNVLVANVMIPKYFSRDVYYEIVTNDSEMLFTVYRLDDASSTYGIVKSVSLELTLAVA